MNRIEENKDKIDSKAICGVFVNEKGQILLAKRTAERTYGPNTYDLMGGDIVPGEEPIETLFRDAKEKFNVQLDGGITELKEPIDMIYPDKTIKTYIFTCQLKSSTPIQLDLHKYDDYGWYYPQEIGRLTLSPKVKEVLTAIGLLRKKL